MSSSRLAAAWSPALEDTTTFVVNPCMGLNHKQTNKKDKFSSTQYFNVNVDQFLTWLQINISPKHYSLLHRRSDNWVDRFKATRSHGLCGAGCKAPAGRIHAKIAQYLVFSVDLVHTDVGLVHLPFEYTMVMNWSGNTWNSNQNGNGSRRNLRIFTDQVTFSYCQSWIKGATTNCVISFVYLVVEF